MSPKKHLEALSERREDLLVTRTQRKQDMGEMDVPTQDKTTEKSKKSSSDEDSSEHCKEHVEAASFKCLPASVRKMDAKSSTSCKKSIGEELEGNDGFQIIDISVLPSMFESLRRPE